MCTNPWRMCNSRVPVDCSKNSCATCCRGLGVALLVVSNELAVDHAIPECLSNPMVCHSVGSAWRPGHIPNSSHSWTTTCWRRWQTFLLADEEHLRGHYLGTEDRNIVEQLGLAEDTENATNALRPRDQIAATASARATNAPRPHPADNGLDRSVRQRIEIAPTAAVGATNAPLPPVRQPVGIAATAAARDPAASSASRAVDAPSAAFTPWCISNPMVHSEPHDRP